MAEAITTLNDHLHREFTSRYRKGIRRFEFVGGRRSGKTYYVCQFLLSQVLKNGDVVNVASMTKEQGRLGAYSDCATIVKGSPSVGGWLRFGKSPREVTCVYNAGRVFFNSYADSETAKGVACDWLFVNEANNFTWQQFIDLAANVRKGVIIDHNPTEAAWFGKYFTPECVIHSSWKNNKFLTEQQLAYFAQLKAAAEAPTASDIDRWLYNVYYLGNYAELGGEIFSGANIHFAQAAPDVERVVVFCDPSALRGADYFAAVLGGFSRADGQVYVFETMSENRGTYAHVAARLREWCSRYDVGEVVVETNGLVGLEFYEFCENSGGLPLTDWYSRGNKFERITANYQRITHGVTFLDTPANREYVKQIYEFSRKCPHDDNVDAISSLVTFYEFEGYDVKDF